MKVARLRRVGINAMFLEPHMGGVETYVRALVPELVRLAPQVHFCVYCNPRGREYLQREGWGEEIELISPAMLGQRGLKAAGELTALGAIAGRNVELLHSVAMTGPLRTRAVSVVTVPDVTWIVAPDPGERWTARLWRVIVPPVARSADRVITHSQAGARHVIEYLGVPAACIDVIPQAAGVSDLSTPTPAIELRSRLGLGNGPVILTVSAKKVHKNLVRLVRSMVAVTERWPDAILVMPGTPTAHEHELRELAGALGVDTNVAFLDYVNAADLEGLYALAHCFVFPSINEGFGIPILEAMRRGVPVACSCVSALPEVAGDAARYFDPLSVSAIGEAVIELFDDRELARDLAARGRERERAFTWRATALSTLDTYERAWLQRL
jgi:glycosyltransferase involved in cell wall biosynthesis